MQPGKPIPNLTPSPLSICSSVHFPSAVSKPKTSPISVQVLWGVAAGMTVSYILRPASASGARTRLVADNEELRAPTTHGSRARPTVCISLHHHPHQRCLVSTAFPGLESTRVKPPEDMPLRKYMSALGQLPPPRSAHPQTPLRLFLSPLYIVSLSFRRRITS